MVCQTGLVGGKGVLGVRQLVCFPIAVAEFHVYINLQVQISDDDTRVSLGSKVSNKGKEGKRDILLFLLFVL